MTAITRREMLQYAGILSLTAAGGWLAGCEPARPGAERAAAAALDYATLDPRDARLFTNRLHLPGRDGPMGVLDVPAAPIDIVARRQSAEYLPGWETPIIAYDVRHEGRTYVNPVLRVRRGDTVAARLLNQLDEGTIIHWHGLHVDQQNDGHPASAVGPGGSYEYRFTVQDRAGAYWYHPHPDMRTGYQAYHGLTGMLLVEDEDEWRLRESLDLELGVTDLPLVLQDRRFDGQGALVYAATPMERFMGFEGEVVLVNGTVTPSLEVATRIYRLRLLNGSNARTYRLAFRRGSAALPFRLIGTDGGLLEAPHPASEVFLSPGERVDLLLDLHDAAEGDAIFLKSLAFDPMHVMTMGGMGGMAGRGPGMGGQATQGSSRLGSGEEFFVLRLDVRRRVRYDLAPPASLSTIEPIAVDGASTRPLNLSRGMMEWFINGEQFSMTRDLFRVRRDSTEIWEFRNAAASMPHPIHIHAVQFEVRERLNTPAQVRGLARDAHGRIATDLGRKDTVLVWPGETVRVAVDLANAFPGDQVYLLHCHNLEHEDAGMMANWRIV